jgi:hypothetical protein
MPITFARPTAAAGVRLPGGRQKLAQGPINNEPSPTDRHGLQGSVADQLPQLRLPEAAESLGFWNRDGDWLQSTG